MAVELWFRTLWKTWRHEEAHQGEAVIGVLGFEVSSSMSKLIHLWRSLSDERVARLRSVLVNSVGIKTLVSEDDHFIIDSVCAEMVESLGHVVKSVARLGKKCGDPTLRSFGHVFDNLVKFGLDPYGWELSCKKMERKVKRMESLICLNAAVYGEMERLSEIERALRKMNGCDATRADYLEYKNQLLHSQQEVKGLQDVSVWNMTYDYVVGLLGRSIFTIFRRIMRVVEANKSAVDSGGIENPRTGSYQCVYHSHSLYALMLSSDDDDPWRNRAPKFPTKSAPNSKPNRCITSENGFHAGVLHGTKGARHEFRRNRPQDNLSIFVCKRRLLDPPPGTLGAAALAQRYASIIVSIERLVASPRRIGQDERDELYSMLPANVRFALRSRLKPFTNNHPGPSVYRVLVASKIRDAMAETLQWLAPLAHNMMRWQAEKGFEHPGFESGQLVLLVQTLYLADQKKTEATIVDLLVGLNYVWRFGRELGAKALVNSPCGLALDEYLDKQG